MAGSVAISIHIVLTFYRMHGLALTLAFVVFWLLSVTIYLRWTGRHSQQRMPLKAKTEPRINRKPAEPWREKQSA